jgi:hypothetical protein
MKYTLSRPFWKPVVFTLTLAVLILGFYSLVVKDILHPLSGGGDTDYWEYTGFYLAKNISFHPLPTLNLTNNESFYPYGVNAVFQPWGIERDLFYAISYSLFGIGGWVQIYYLVSISITFSGTFLLLYRDYHFARSLGAGLLVTLGSFYTVNKYPVQAGYAIIHWTTLSFIADFLIVKRCVLRQKLSFQLILIRLLILVLSLGQELGYVAGFALTSFAVSAFFMLALLVFRWQKRQISLDKIVLILGSWRRDILSSKFTTVFLSASILCVLYFNLPLVLEISRSAKSFDFSKVPSGSWWVSPFRLLVPFLPFLNPSQPFVNEIFKDVPEGIGFEGSPGYFLLILGGFGLWHTRKQIAIFIPLILIFITCVFYYPALRIFPWFQFFRLGGRATMIYPIVLTLFALHFHWPEWRLGVRKLTLFLILLVACLEFFTFYSFRTGYQPYVFASDFWDYMARVQAQPGEAVLDFPFCATGGNAVGSAEGLCPYYGRTMSNFSLRRFHEKKVIGQYFGRLHPDQISYLQAAGWPKLFFPNSTNIFEASGQTRCFYRNEWQFFENFYRLNDFAGINLYTDLLPQSCVEDFYQRFGRPIKETTVPLTGKVVFIPKPSQMRNQVDKEKGKNLKLDLE